jgi:hypothetical protein
VQISPHQGLFPQVGQRPPVQDPAPDLEANSAQHGLGAPAFVRRVFPDELHDIFRVRRGCCYGHAKIIWNCRALHAGFADTAHMDGHDEARAVLGGSREALRMLSVTEYTR